MSEPSAALPRRFPARSSGVSVIIPTVDRPQEVRRAVRSALDQSVAPLEVIVAHDGPDPAAVAGLAELDPRVRVIEVGPHPKNAGSSARNVGVAAARGAWVAFLDDDDEWLPGKLEAQLAAVRTDAEHLILAGRAERRSGRGSVIWPLRAPHRGERIGDYLFVREYAGEGWLPTPVLMVPTALARQVPFDEALQQHEDLDWLLRLEAQGASLEVIPETVAVVHYDDSGSSLSGTGTWRGALEWAHLRRPELGETAFGAFCLTEVPRHIRHSSKPEAVVAIVRAAASGRPRTQEWNRFIATIVLPDRVADRVRALRERGMSASREPRLRTIVQKVCGSIWLIVRALQ